MLGPREFATLMLVNHAKRTSGVDESDLRTLLERKRVEFVIGACASMQPRVAERGVLERLHVRR